MGKYIGVQQTSDGDEPSDVCWMNHH